MSECIQFRPANCKDCHKCIRHCPVKSIRFTNHQANIDARACILCGNCFVVCPQNAKQIRNDVPAAKALIASGAPVYAEIAENDKIIAAAEFTNFIFGDILSPDAAQ